MMLLVPKNLFLVKGASMLPTLKQGDIVEISNKENLRVGDIIIFKLNKKRIIHRIIKIKEDQIISKGDNRVGCDLPIKFKDITGKVIKVQNKDLTTRYYTLINPIIAKVSLLSSKLYPKKAVPSYFQNLKFKLIGNKDLGIERSMLFLLRLPYKVSLSFFKLIIK